MILAIVSIRCIVYAKNDYIQNPSACICENGKYLKSIVDNSILVCNEIIKAADNVSSNVTNTISTKCYEYCVNKCL